MVSAQVLGGQQSAVEIVAEPERLQAYRLTMSNLRNALADANQPRVYLGEVDDGNEVFPVSFQGQFRDLRQIDETLIDASIPLRLGDVAEVDYGLQQRTDLRRVNGQSAVGILIQKEDEANLIAVADAATAAIAQLNRDFAPEGVSLIVSGTFGHGEAHGAVRAVPQGQFAPSGRGGRRRVPSAMRNVGGGILFYAATGSHRRGNPVFGVR